MANEQLINSMLKCDGTKGNCVECIFRDNPECRNAMAHHGGALIQLQDVVIHNQAVTASKVGSDKRMLQIKLETSERERAEMIKRMRALLDYIYEQCGCKACEHYDGDACKHCKDKDEWELSDEIYEAYARKTKGGDDDDDDEEIDPEEE